MPVVLHEMRPVRGTDAHQTDGLAELVCSNSFRSDDWECNAVGLLHAEMRRCGSLIMALRRRAPGAGRRRAGGGPRRLLRGGHRAAARPTRWSPSRAARWRACRPPDWDSVIDRHRPPHLAGPRRGDPGADRRGRAGLLRRHRPDRARRQHRHGHRLAPVALRQGRPGRRRGGLHQLPDGQGASTRPSSTPCWPARRPSSRTGSTSPISTAACPSR